MADTLVNVVPTYGYGWVATRGGRARDTPAPFQVRLNYEGEGEWRGLIETANHEFDGMMVRVSQRVEQWEGTVNVDVDGAATGWATIRDYRLLRSRDQGE